jgi:hypothetical protein
MSIDELNNEIDELTSMLRNAPSLSELRLALFNKGLNPATTQLASFVEDEELKEYGVVVSDNGEIFEFVRDNGTCPATEFVTWVHLQNISSSLAAAYPTIPIALGRLQVAK